MKPSCKLSEDDDIYDSLMLILEAKIKEFAKQETGNYVDELGFGSWLQDLNPAEMIGRAIICICLDNLYNQPALGRCINSVYNTRSIWPSYAMHPNNFEKLYHLAKLRIMVCSNGGYATYDTPAVYLNNKTYFQEDGATHLKYKGSGGGRKRVHGAPEDYQEGEDYYRGLDRTLRLTHFAGTGSTNKTYKESYLTSLKEQLRAKLLEVKKSYQDHVS